MMEKPDVPDFKKDNVLGVVLDFDAHVVTYELNGVGFGSVDGIPDEPFVFYIAMGLVCSWAAI